MEALYKRHGALPLAISLIQDNTCRECKNQTILKCGVRLIAQNILESITFVYPEQGHTHGPMDGTFGPMCVKLSLEEFHDDLNVVDILDDVLKTSGNRCIHKAGCPDPQAGCAQSGPSGLRRWT